MGLQGLIQSVRGFIAYSLLLLVGVALLVFFWGLMRYVWNAGDEKKKTEGKSIMIWGVIALFVMVSVWGLVAFLQANLGVNSNIILDYTLN